LAIGLLALRWRCICIRERLVKSTNGIGLALLMGVVGAGAGYFLRGRTDRPVPFASPGPTGSVRTVIKGTAPRIVALTNEFNWVQLESEDYRTYIARLRSIGCPEQTIRDIVIADLDKLLAPRLHAIYRRRPDVQYWHSEEEEMDNDLDQRESQRQERELDKEKRAVIQELLGTDLVRERMKQVGKEDYYERRLAFLPEEKRNQVRGILDACDENEARIHTKEWEEGDVLTATDRAELRRLEGERRARIAAVLSPADQVQYELWLSPTANAVRHALYGMNATEQEFLGVYQIRKAFEENWGEVDTVTMDPATRAQLDQARLETEARIEKQLGEQRYAEYKRGEDDDFHRLNATVSRYRLPREKAAEVYEYKRALEGMRAQVMADANLNAQQKQAALEAMVHETRKVVGQALGSKAFRYYEMRGDGAWLRK